ncbi:hypothetical protein [Dactylosporangium sp. NPDC000521]|uniref:hypothetical protein n=1 Tax=Dactylosporangium sp. NPDC000521 TaxID=3363975 RepID=UPI0036AD1315
MAAKAHRGSRVDRRDAAVSRGAKERDSGMIDAAFSTIATVTTSGTPFEGACSHD